MSDVELELHAMAEGPDLGKAAHARAELKRRKYAYLTRQETNRRTFEERLVKDQIEATEKNAKAQHKVARLSIWAGAFAAAAAVALAVVAISELVIHLSEPQSVAPAAQSGEAIHP